MHTLFRYASACIGQILGLYIGLHIGIFATLTEICLPWCARTFIAPFRRIIPAKYMPRYFSRLMRPVVTPYDVLEVDKENVNQLYPLPSTLSNLSRQFGEHKQITVRDGVKLHFVMNGHEEHERNHSKKPLLVCLHGFPECWVEWLPFLKHFSNDYVVVAPDLRGYGASDKPSACWFGASHYKMQELVDDVREIIESLGYRQAVIASHDWGGMIAWKFAAVHPNMVKKLIVMAAPEDRLFLKNATWAQFLKSWYIFFFQLPWLPEYFMRRNGFSPLAMGPFITRRMGLYKPERFTTQDLAAYLWNASQPGFVSAAINYYRNVFGQNQLHPRSALHGGKYPMPILVFVPMHDAALGPDLYKNIESIGSNVSVKHLNDSSHWVLYDALEKVIKDCYEFLDIPKNKQKPVHFHLDRNHSGTIQSVKDVVSKLSQQICLDHVESTTNVASADSENDTTNLTRTDSENDTSTIPSNLTCSFASASTMNSNDKVVAMCVPTTSESPKASVEDQTQEIMENEAREENTQTQENENSQTHEENNQTQENENNQTHEENNQTQENEKNQTHEEKNQTQENEKNQTHEEKNDTNGGTMKSYVSNTLTDAEATLHSNNNLNLSASVKNISQAATSENGAMKHKNGTMKQEGDTTTTNAHSRKNNTRKRRGGKRNKNK